MFCPTCHTVFHNKHELDEAYRMARPSNIDAVASLHYYLVVFTKNEHVLVDEHVLAKRNVVTITTATNTAALYRFNCAQYQVEGNDSRQYQ